MNWDKTRCSISCYILLVHSSESPITYFSGLLLATRASMLRFAAETENVQRKLPRTVQTFLSFLVKTITVLKLVLFPSSGKSTKRTLLGIFDGNNLSHRRLATEKVSISNLMMQTEPASETLTFFNQNENNC